MGLCLSKTEVAELSRSRLRKKQVKFLVSNGIRHYLDDHGWPVVPRSAIDPTPAPAQDKPRWSPNKAP